MLSKYLKYLTYNVWWRRLLGAGNILFCDLGGSNKGKLTLWLIIVYFSVHKLYFNNKVHKNTHIYTVGDGMVNRQSYTLLLGM